MKKKIFGKNKNKNEPINNADPTIENQNQYDPNFTDYEHSNVNQNFYNEETDHQNNTPNFDNDSSANTNSFYDQEQPNKNNIDGTENSPNAKLKPKFSNGRIYVENKESMPNYFNTNGNYLYDETLNKHDKNFEVNFHKDNDKLLYKIRNLGADGTKFNKKYLNMTLHGINVDIYSGDRIVILSDLKNYDNFFVDLLKNKVKKNDGNIFAIKKKSSTWTDAHEEGGSSLFNQEINFNSLEDINYNSIVSFRNSLVVILSKIISKFELAINNTVVIKFLEEFFLIDNRNKSFNDLSKSEQNRFILLCDILLKKRIIYAAYIGIDLNIRDKIHFYRFLSEYITNRDIVFFLVTNDIIELKILCNKIIIIANRTIKEEKYFREILKYYESIDDYIILNIK